MKYYLRALLLNIFSFLPVKKYDYVSLIKNSYKEKKSPFLMTIVLNALVLMLTIVIDVLVYKFSLNYLESLFIHLGLAAFYFLHFNMYRNNLLFLFSYIFILISIFVFKYWTLTFLFIMFTTYYLLDVICSKII